MSTNNPNKRKEKLISVGLLIVLLGSIIGAFRQAGVYYYTNRKLSQKEKELKRLEEKNRALKVRLEEIQRPEFLDEEARKLLGLGDAGRGGLVRPTPVPEGAVFAKEAPAEPVNFQKWWRLFVY